MTGKEKLEQNEKKGFFAKIIERIDKKMEEKAKKSSCCGGGSEQKKGSTCC